MENNKISVLHTIEDLKLTSGGPTRTVLGLVNALSKIDIDVFLATQNLLHEEYLSPKKKDLFLSNNHLENNLSIIKLPGFLHLQFFLYDPLA